jgi:hypothetical protein
MDLLDQFITSAPNLQDTVDIFKGEWSSKLPESLGELHTGSVGLFNDARIEWAAQQLGGFENKTVLELGPLEGGHTSMIEHYGAASITAIESNTHAYLKCLIVKEILGLQRAHFLYGDFIEFLKSNSASFDIGIASGVLYHMRNPVELIALLAKTCNRLFIWTHYYDEAILSANPHLSHKFSEGVPEKYGDFSHTLYRQEYKEALNWTGFCGGNAPHSQWMNRDDILRCCKHFGFDEIQTHFEQPDHPNGPSFAFVAVKNSHQSNRERQLQENVGFGSYSLQSQQNQRQLQQSQSEIKELARQLEAAQNQIAAMKTSKFWQLRSLWFKVKKTVGLPTDD